MSEATRRSALVKRLREATMYVVLRHEDVFTAGHLDISVTGCGRTLWIETKWLELTWQNKLQEETARRLAENGRAMVIVFYGHGGADVMTVHGVKTDGVQGRGQDMYDDLIAIIRRELRR